MNEYIEYSEKSRLFIMQLARAKQNKQFKFFLTREFAPLVFTTDFFHHNYDSLIEDFLKLYKIYHKDRASNAKKKIKKRLSEKKLIENFSKHYLTRVQELLGIALETCQGLKPHNPKQIIRITTENDKINIVGKNKN